MNDEHAAHELLIESLNDEATLKSYKEPLDTYRPGLMPRLLGGILVWCGNVIYGKKPSYLKFRAVEVIARVPYHSWSSVAFTLLTLFYRTKSARSASRAERASPDSLLIMRRCMSS